MDINFNSSFTQLCYYYWHVSLNLSVIGSFRLVIEKHRIFTMRSYWVHNTIVGIVRSIVIQLGHPIINEHTITLHFDRYIYSRNYFNHCLNQTLSTAREVYLESHQHFPLFLINSRQPLYSQEMNLLYSQSFLDSQNNNINLYGNGIRLVSVMELALMFPLINTYGVLYY